MRKRTDDELLTLAEVGLRLKVRDRRTVLRLLEQSGVAVIRVGRARRVRASSIERMLAELEWRVPTRAPVRESEKRARGDTASVTSLSDRRQRRRGDVSGDRARRGWTESLGDGVYRRHRLSCRASTTEKAGTRCDCPFACHQPTAVPGKTSLKTIEGASTAAEARKLKKRIQGAERPSSRDGDGTIKLDTFFRDVFLKVARLDDSTKDNYLDIYEREIKPIFGHRRLVDITEEAVERWVRELEQEARERRVQTGRRATGWVVTQTVPFRSALSHAVRWRRIKTNPFAYIEFGEVEPKEADEAETGNPKKVLTREQLQLLYETARTSIHVSKHDRYEALVRCGAELGLRNGEARGLRYSDFDFGAGKVRLQRQFDKKGRLKWLKGKEERTLPVSRRLLELVAALLEAEIAGGGSAETYVFPGRDGRQMAQNTASAMLGRLLIKANLVDETGRPLLSFHGLRHTCASLLFAQGVAPVKISRFLGHASLQVTLTTYCHLLSADELDGLAGVFDQFNEDSGSESEQLAA